MKSKFLSAIVKSLFLSTFFSLAAGSIQASGHLPSSWEVQGTNYAQIIDSDVTEIDDGLIRIQNQNAVVFTFTKNRDDFPSELSGDCFEIQLMKITDQAPYSTDGVCYAVDIEGDHITFTYHGNGLEGGTWTTGNGTGKYEGMSSSGTTSFEAPLHEGFIVSFEGKQTLE